MLVNINGLKKNIEKGLTILQACESQGVTIPHFCYHDKLSIAGNCRMCLVEDSKSLKLLASCAVNINANMQIFTNTELVKKARESVLEFLLANHPLDCPICDQGGECDLQDQSLVFGGDQGRFYESKRAVENKNFGPLVKTIMTRCIHCTRCIRFADEIAGTSYMGITGRGSKSEIGFYIEKILNSEISGNIVDLCPVGALTSKPYAFTARSWELQSFESIDFFDAFNSTIRIDTRGARIMRILPRVNASLNEDWISDKIRFVYDSLKYQRLTCPMVKKDESFVKISWSQAFSIIKDKVSLNFLEPCGLTGPFTDVETTVGLKEFINKLGSSNINNSGLYQEDYFEDLSSYYRFNVSKEDLDKADFCLLIGTNVRWEAPILNIKLRKLFLKGVNIYNFGFKSSSNYFIKQLGNNPAVLLQLFEGSHWLCTKLAKAKNPLIIIGSSFFHRTDVIKNLLPYFLQISKRINWQGLNVLPQTSSIINRLEVGCVKGIHGQPSAKGKLQFILGKSLNNMKFSSKDYSVYIGHHGDSFIKNVDMILPSASPFEKTGKYLNIFGTVQKTKAIFFGLNNVKNDWEVLNSLSVFLGLGKLSFTGERLKELSPFLQSKGSMPFLNYSNQSGLSFVFKSKIFNSPFVPVVTNFYKTDSMSLSSKILNRCSSSFVDNKGSFQD